MKTKVYISIIAAILLAVWVYVFSGIDGAITPEGIFAAMFLTAISFVILLALAEVVRRVRTGEPVVAPADPKPRKLPFWYRLLSKIFR